MHETESDQTWNFGLLGYCFKVQMCFATYYEPHILLMHPLNFYSIYFDFYSLLIQNKLNKCQMNGLRRMTLVLD